jgi:transcriptional regulator
MTSPFDDFCDDDAADLIAEYPLAWVAAAHGDPGLASLLPLLAERDACGRVVGLIGHMARRNPLFPALSVEPRALILFQGPQGYISPGWVRDRTWAPTWNYAQLRAEAELTFVPEGGDAALSALVQAMEAGRDEPWRIDALGPRYRPMEHAIIAFRARITALRGRFKLGQDERPEILADILAGLPDPALARWMRRFNKGRL